MNNLTNYRKVIQSLRSFFNKTKHVYFPRPVCVADYRGIDNKLIKVIRGQVRIRQHNQQCILTAGDYFFFPEMKAVEITYGVLDDPSQAKKLSSDEFVNMQELYCSGVNNPSTFHATGACLLGIVSFNARAYDAVDVFRFLDIPGFQIKSAPFLHHAVDTLLQLINLDTVSKVSLISLYTQILGVELMQYILKEKLYLDRIVFKIGALTEPRLRKIFQHISENLDKDLSNAALGALVNLSPDYVGQFFKKITDINLQEYIEGIRLYKAAELLETTTMNVSALSKAVGYSEISYFCRKFLEFWGLPAKKMQRRLKRERGAESGLARK